MEGPVERVRKLLNHAEHSCASPCSKEGCDCTARPKVLHSRDVFLELLIVNVTDLNKHFDQECWSVYFHVAGGLLASPDITSPQREREALERTFRSPVYKYAPLPYCWYDIFDDDLRVSIMRASLAANSTVSLGLHHLTIEQRRGLAEDV
jgi:hypothetical protein